MAERNNLLFELGTEELPPNTLLKLSESLSNNIQKGLDQAKLDYADVNVFATPRRLAVVVENLEKNQTDKVIEKRGPALKAAFDENGKPSKAAEGFAKSCQTTVAQLGRLKNAKGEWLAYTENIKGQQTEAIVPEIIKKSISALPIAKRMRWGGGTAEFVRPVHWVVLLFGDEVIKTNILDIETGSVTFGHRFHAPQAIALTNADEYAEKLFQDGRVVAIFAKRKSLIRKLAEQKANEVSGKIFINESLLDEVTALVEWPVPILGAFDRRYLELPNEVLMTTMQDNQKYFPLFSQDGVLLPFFITISNLESTHPESIKSGNERVVKPRLADAEFFWKQDRKKTLAERVKELEHIVFQNKLGSLADKTKRVEWIVKEIAANLDVESEHVQRAAFLSKADLMTEMVGEFPSLQGVMGKYYALAEGEIEAVAIAIEEQYYPKQSGGNLPDSLCGQILSVAEKIDTLTGIFSVGLIPTGDKDPYALRRAAIGSLRIIIEKELDLDLMALIKSSLNQYKHPFHQEETEALIINFVYERIKGICLENSYSIDEYDAVLAVNPLKPVDFMQRLQAVKSFRQLPEAKSLAAANKRIKNILRKSETKANNDFSRLVTIEEKKLFDAGSKTALTNEPLLFKRDYQSALNNLAQLAPVVDGFFDHVMVMTDDLQLRSSRLGLLKMISDQFLQIADISKLQS